MGFGRSRGQTGAEFENENRRYRCRDGNAVSAPHAGYASERKRKRARTFFDDRITDIYIIFVRRETNTVAAATATAVARAVFTILFRLRVVVRPHEFAFRRARCTSCYTYTRHWLLPPHVSSRGRGVRGMMSYAPNGVRSPDQLRRRLNNRADRQNARSKTPYKSVCGVYLYACAHVCT